MFKSLFALFLFATAVFAQTVVIALPTYNQTVSAGGNLTVQVERPDTLSSSEEVAVVIGVKSCATGACIPPLEYFGTILYNGPFNPQFPVPSNQPPYQPFQNFTVQIPSTIPTGPALIEVAHFTLIGASYGPYLEILNQTITIV